jgi:hypothetical protein
MWRPYTVLLSASLSFKPLNCGYVSVPASAMAPAILKMNIVPQSPLRPKIIQILLSIFNYKHFYDFYWKCNTMRRICVKSSVLLLSRTISEVPCRDFI